MRIALIADVHANLPALESVLAHARLCGADEFWNLGDMVGYGPFPDECVKLLHKICRRNVAGNYDKKVISKKKIEKMREKGKDRDKIFSFEWTLQHLSEEAVDFIRMLPSVQPVDVETRRILITHGSPEGDEDGLTPLTPLSRLEELAKLTDAEMVLCGHTHLPFDRSAAGVRFVNPGGTGRSFDGDIRASYCLLDVSRDHFAVEHFRVKYDSAALFREMKACKFPERLIRSLLEGRSLDELDDSAPSAGADAIVARALDLGAKHKIEKEHALKVTSLALRIFDGLRPVHGLGGRERLYLQCGGLLHDVGFSTDPARHHKAGRDIILEADELPLSRRERIIVGLLARYHRGGMPESGHRYYEEISERDRNIVDVLAGVLRVADGLDRSHGSRVHDITVSWDEGTVTLELEASSGADEEEHYALLKGDLLQNVLKKILVVRRR